MNNTGTDSCSLLKHGRLRNLAVLLICCLCAPFAAHGQQSADPDEQGDAPADPCAEVKESLVTCETKVTGLEGEIEALMTDAVTLNDAMRKLEASHKTSKERCIAVKKEIVSEEPFMLLSFWLYHEDFGAVARKDRQKSLADYAAFEPKKFLPQTLHDYKDSDAFLFLIQNGRFLKEYELEEAEEKTKKLTEFVQTIFYRDNNAKDFEYYFINTF